MFFSGVDAIDYGQFEARDEIGNFVSKFGFSTNCYNRSFKILRK